MAHVLWREEALKRGNSGNGLMWEACRPPRATMTFRLGLLPSFVSGSVDLPQLNYTDVRGSVVTEGCKNLAPHMCHIGARGLYQCKSHSEWSELPS